MMVCEPLVLGELNVEKRINQVVKDSGNDFEEKDF